MNGIGKRYLIDTNIFIYYFNGDTIVQPIFNEVITGDTNGYYSPISWVELLCYSDLSDKEANQMRSSLRLLTCVALSESVLDQAARIRRDHRVALADAVIAACAIEISGILVTRNSQDFQRISNLSLLNPFTSYS